MREQGFAIGVGSRAVGDTGCHVAQLGDQVGLLARAVLGEFRDLGLDLALAGCRRLALGGLARGVLGLALGELLDGLLEFRRDLGARARGLLRKAGNLSLDFVLFGEQGLAVGLVGGAVGNLAERAAQLVGQRHAAAYLLLDQAIELCLDIALMRSECLAVGLRAGAISQAIDRAAHLDRELGEAGEQILLGSHGLGQRRQAVDQVGVRAGRRLTAVLDALQGARETVESLGVAFEQGLDVGGNAAAGGLSRHRGNAGGAGQPLFEFGVEAALCLAGLQFEEAQHERAGKTEQRGAERRRHALQRALDAALELREHRDGVACRRLKAVDRVGHGADGLQ